MSSFATDSGHRSSQLARDRQGARPGGSQLTSLADVDLEAVERYSLHAGGEWSTVGPFGLPPITVSMLGMSRVDIPVDQLPPLPRWETVETVAVPALGPSSWEQVSTSRMLGIDHAEVIRPTTVEAWTENAEAVHCRHLQLINSIEKVISKLLDFYSPGRFAQLMSQLGSDEERQVLVTLRGMRRASRDLGE